MPRFLISLALVGALAIHIPLIDRGSQKRLIERTRASIVHVTGRLQVPFAGWVGYDCTGFVIAKNRVLTANHCVGVLMQADGQTVWDVLRQDQYLDLALLNVETKKKLPLQISPVAPEAQDEVFGVGYGEGAPWPTAKVFLVQFTNATPNYAELPPSLWVTPEYTEGMSGGPVVNYWGLVVSVVQMNTEDDQYGHGVAVSGIHAFLAGVYQ